MTRIVVGYDEGAAARVASDWAAVRAARDDARVELVAVTDMFTTDYPQTDRGLESAAAEVRLLSPNIAVSSHHVDGGMPATLVEDAREADLLVIGVHRSHPIRSALSGSMPTRLSARAHSPVCLVPDTWQPNDRPVTIGVDDDDSSDAALLFAADEAARSDTRLRIVHAWSMPTPTIDGAVSLLASPLEVKEAHRHILKNAVQRVVSSHPHLEIEQQLIPEAPGSALAALAPDSSLLVLGTHHHGRFMSALFGSVGADLIGHIDCTICIVPPHPEE